MKTLLIISILLLQTGLSLARADDMEQQFRNPPQAVGPYVWWHWMGANVSKEGITKDLEAMKASGIGGATIFNLTSAVMAGAAPTKNLPFPDITYRSPKYWEMVTFAASEAQRLGLELGMHNCVGYSATGGPWVTPEISMQRVVFTVTPVSGDFSGKLKQPSTKLDFYRDIAVLAVPEGNPIDPKAIIDLTGKMDTQGNLTWQAPAGNWSIYRFGHTSTGAAPKPIPEDVQALEVDKMSTDASRFHFEQVINPLKEHLGSLMGKSFRHLTLDSYEAGTQNWTPKFRDEFLKRKGYDPIPWLPLLDTQSVVEGKKKKDVPKLILGSEDQTNRFLWDFKDVIAQLYQECNFEQGANLMHTAGLQMQFEAYGGPFDTIAGTATADIPMCEFWTEGVSSDRPGKPGSRSAFAAARAAGRPIMAAEALTGWPHKSRFTENPARLKVPGDGAYALGVNRLVLHHWVHQPFGDAFKPGIGMGWWGTHFGRNQTWAEPGKAYYKYLARIQSLLQRGEGVGDFLSLDRDLENSDVITRATLLKGNVRVENGRIVLPSGRSYPFLVLPDGTSMLPEVARKVKELVSQGAVVVGPKPSQSPSLTGYPASDEEVRRIAEDIWGSDDPNTKGKVLTAPLPLVLERFGLTKPAVSFDAQDDNLLATARRDGDTDIFFIANTGTKPRRTTASFRVTGKVPEIWNPEDGSHTPAGLWRKADGRTELTLTLDAKDSLFVLFRRPTSDADHAVDFTTGAASPSPWRLGANAQGQPVLLAESKLTGEILCASGKRIPVNTDTPPPLPVTGEWKVSFDPGLGAPAQIEFPQLTSWSDHSDPGIKYFSGTAVYSKEIDLPASAFGSGKRLVLDLGKVANLASVKVNGTDLGVVWHAPFQIDATTALKPGRNTLKVAVTNTWANRLIGDEQEPADIEWGGTQTLFGKEMGQPLVAYPDWFVKRQPRPSTNRKTFSTWNYFTKDSPLFPAGLLGPVVIRQVQEIPL